MDQETNHVSIQGTENIKNREITIYIIVLPYTMSQRGKLNRQHKKHSLQKSVKLPDKILGCTQEILKVSKDLSEELQSPEYICNWFVNL